MTRRRSAGLRALLALAGALAVLVGAELRPGAAVRPTAGDNGTWTLPPRTMVSRSIRGAQIGQEQEAILARPLFAEGRRPAAVSGDDRLPRLAGIVRGPAVAIALFASPDEGKPSRLLRVDDGLAGWRIARIDADAVTLIRGADTMRLEPRFATAQAPAVPVLSLASIKVLSTKRSNPQLAW